MANDRGPQQLADDLAVAAGRQLRNTKKGIGWFRSRTTSPQPHPFPVGDLNALAAAWPEGEWYLEVSCFVSLSDGKRWSAYAATDYVDGEETRSELVDEQPTEWEARARLLLAVLKEAT